MNDIHPRILTFYNSHPELDFNSVNLMLIDLLEKVSLQQNSINSQMFQNLFQEPMTALLNSTEERIIHSMKEPAGKKPIQHTSYYFKQLLNQIYLTSDVNVIQNTLGLHLFLMKRPNKSKILFASKDTDINIETDDLHKFVATLEEYNCSGIFVSQHSGISNKPNYQIEYMNGNIIVFIQNADYSHDKIKIAVDIIDNLTSKLRDFTAQQDENSIPKNVLDDINKEYQLFISQKEALIGIYKDCQKKVLTQIDELRFPCLDKYLSTKYTSQPQKHGFKCDLCKAFNANNLKALAAHKRGCIRKNNVTVVSAADAIH